MTLPLWLVSDGMIWMVTYFFLLSGVQNGQKYAKTDVQYKFWVGKSYNWQFLSIFQFGCFGNNV